MAERLPSLHCQKESHRTPHRGGGRGGRECIAFAAYELKVYRKQPARGPERRAVQTLDYGAAMMGKSVKDVDRYQAVLNSLLALEENKFCADCESKGGCFLYMFPPSALSPFIPAENPSMSRPSRSFTTGECCISCTGSPPIRLYYGRDGATSSHWRGMRLHHARNTQTGSCSDVFIERTSHFEEYK